MVKQLILPFAGVAIFIVLVGLFVKNSDNIKIPNVTPSTQTQGSAKTVKVGDKVIQVEIADTPEKREKGLSGKTGLPEDSGMLFVFDPTNKMPGFWMKDMVISLDIIWIKSDVIVKIDKNVPPPKAGTPDSELPVYSPGQPVDSVLEVIGGYCDTNGISVGSKVDL